MGNPVKNKRELILEHRRLMIKLAQGDKSARLKMDEIEEELEMSYEELGYLAKRDYLRGYTE